MGHEFIGVVEEAGSDVSTLSVGDFVIAPFAVSCGHCEFCRAGLQTSWVNGGFWNDPSSARRAGRPRPSACRWPTEPSSNTTTRWRCPRPSPAGTQTI
jgi:hypothetical protein